MSVYSPGIYNNDPIFRLLKTKDEIPLLQQSCFYETRTPTFIFLKNDF